MNARRAVCIFIIVILTICGCVSFPSLRASVPTSPLVFQNQMQLLGDLFRLPVLVAGWKLNVEDKLLERALLRIRPAGEGGFVPQIPLHVAASVAAHFIADRA